MNKIFAPLKSADKIILLLVGMLGLISVLMLESTVYDDGIVLARPVLVQAISYIIGFCVLVVIQHIDYRYFIGLEKFLYIAAIVLLLLVYMPGLGVEQYGSRAWIDLGITTLQPSEFVKILFVLIMAGYLSEHRDDLGKFSGVFKAGLVALPIILVVLKEDLGSALVYIVMWIFMVFFAGIDYKLFIRSALVALAAIPVMYRFLDAYQKERIEAFLHPENLNLSGNQSGISFISGLTVWNLRYSGIKRRPISITSPPKPPIPLSQKYLELEVMSTLVAILLYLLSPSPVKEVAI